MIVDNQINGLFPGKLHPDSVIGGCINVFENAWPNPQHTIDVVEKECAKIDSDISWTHAQTFGKGSFQNTRTNLDLGITSLSMLTGNAILQNIHNQMYIMLLAATAPYFEKYKIEEYIYHEPYNMLKYRAGEQYYGHYDGSTASGRAISAVVYLNSNYEGGELEFPNFGLKIKPEPGMLILFPSNFAYRHIAHPIKSGTKYALVTWLRDRDNF